MKKVRVSVRIRGRVQGVNFRYYTQQTARHNNLGGWVKNLPNGEVEAVFEGSEPDVLQMLQWCRQGPSAARVDHVDIEWGEFQGEFSSFNVTF